MPIESTHPYGDNGDCTWVFDNRTSGFDSPGITTPTASGQLVTDPAVKAVGVTIDSVTPCP